VKRKHREKTMEEQRKNDRFLVSVSSSVRSRMVEDPKIKIKTSRTKARNRG
jgi:hypothetical protein